MEQAGARTPRASSTDREERGQPASAELPAPPTVAELGALRERLEEQHSQALGRVGSLMRAQTELTSGIAEELTGLQEDGGRLEALERGEESSAGLIAQLRGRLTRRKRLLERQSVAVRLQEQYREVHTTLRRAGVFADDLRVCAVELAQAVDRLHAQVEDSLGASSEVDQRCTELQAELQALEAAADITEQRRRDRLRFELDDLRTAASLHEARAQLCSQQVAPARALRDTVHSLHKEMALYVLQAGAAVERSGRRVQALGLAADAPVVIAELQDGLAQLDAAMSVTEAYLAQAHDMLTRVLPELTEQIRSQGSQAALDLDQGLAVIAAAKEGRASDEALRAAALAEVELLGVVGEARGDESA